MKKWLWVVGLVMLSGVAWAASSDKYDKSTTVTISGTGSYVTPKTTTIAPAANRKVDSIVIGGMTNIEGVSGTIIFDPNAYVGGTGHVFGTDDTLTFKVYGRGGGTRHLVDSDLIVGVTNADTVTVAWFETDSLMATDTLVLYWIWADSCIVQTDSVANSVVTPNLTLAQTTARRTSGTISMGSAMSIDAICGSIQLLAASYRGVGTDFGDCDSVTTVIYSLMDGRRMLIDSQQWAIPDSLAIPRVDADSLFLQDWYIDYIIADSAVVDRDSVATYTIKPRLKIWLKPKSD